MTRFSVRRIGDSPAPAADRINPTVCANQNIGTQNEHGTLDPVSLRSREEHTRWQS